MSHASGSHSRRSSRGHDLESVFSPTSRGSSRRRSDAPSVPPSPTRSSYAPSTVATPTTAQSNGYAHPRKRQRTGESHVVTPDPDCSFCEGNVEHNRQGVPEEMISCSRCGSSGHFSCLQMTSARLIDTVKSYPWVCMECKRCEHCGDDDDDLLFCDRCDRGWHGQCLTPPLTSAPKGNWICPMCRRTTVDGINQPRNGRRVHHPVPPARPSSQIIPQTKRFAANGHVSDSDDDTHPTQPSRNAVAGSIGTAKRNSPRKQKQRELRRQEKGKERAREEVGIGDPAVSKGPRIKLPNGFFGGSSAVSASGLKVRIKLPTASGEQEEAEEERLPYGGVLVGEAAKQDDRLPAAEDRKKFEKARALVETRLAAEAALPFDPRASVRIGSSNMVIPALQEPDGEMNSYLRVRVIDGNSKTPTESMPGTPIPLPDGHFSNIRRIRFGTFEIETWYQAPYPEEFCKIPDGRLWLCEFCLKYMKSAFQASRHRLKCKTRHPPGDEIYRDGNVSVFEVDGRKNKIYCQNLCLLAKMFLDHKTLYYDVDPFLFYVMTESDGQGAQFVGYFSKEKRSPTNNVSCIMTLPVRQRRGWGNLLVDFSYLLSRKEGRAGTPEKPLSDLGLVLYRGYWLLTIFRTILGMPRDQEITIEEISKRTSITREEVYYILRDQQMITEGTASPKLPSNPSSPVLPAQHRRHGIGRRHAEDDDDEIHVPEVYKIYADRPRLKSIVAKQDAKGYLSLKPDKLKWTPFLTTRGAPVPPAPNAARVEMENALFDDESAAIEVLHLPHEPQPVVVNARGIEIDSSIVLNRPRTPPEAQKDTDKLTHTAPTPPSPGVQSPRSRKSSMSHSARKSPRRGRRQSADAEVAQLLLSSQKRSLRHMDHDEDADAEGEDDNGMDVDVY